MGTLTKSIYKWFQSQESTSVPSCQALGLSRASELSPSLSWQTEGDLDQIFRHRVRLL